MAFAQTALQPNQLPAGLACESVTQAHADASAGTPNVSADGSPLPGVAAPDISKGFQGIPRSAQPTLTASQRRIPEPPRPSLSAPVESGSGMAAFPSMIKHVRSGFKYPRVGKLIAEITAGSRESETAPRQPQP